MIDELMATPIHIRALADLQLRLSKAHAYNSTLLTLIAKMKENEESLRAEVSAVEEALTDETLAKDAKQERQSELQKELEDQRLAWEQVCADRDLWRSQMLQVALAAGIDLSNVDSDAPKLRAMIVDKLAGKS